MDFIVVFFLKGTGEGKEWEKKEGDVDDHVTENQNLSHKLN